MATKTKQPANKQPAASTKPATEKPAANTGVGIKELASDLGRNPKSVRAAIRRFKGGAQVGQGGRYRWDSKNDPAYQELVSQLSAKGADDDNETE